MFMKLYIDSWPIYVSEFLNVDDEGDYHEDGDNDLPDAENGSLDNSGWSSRTRLVFYRILI